MPNLSDSARQKRRKSNTLKAVAKARSAPRAAPSRRTAAALLPDAERNALALESINENVYEWNLDSGELYFSPSLRAMLGLGPNQELSNES